MISMKSSPVPVLVASCSHTTPLSMTSRVRSPGRVTERRAVTWSWVHASAGEPRPERLIGARGEGSPVRCWGLEGAISTTGDTITGSEPCDGAAKSWSMETSSSCAME